MFDIKVQHRDSKTGRVKDHNPYRLHTVSGKRYFERPLGSGHLYYENGEQAGQMVWENDGKKKVIKEGMAHSEYNRPLTVNEKMQREFDSRGNKIDNLEAKIAELEAIQIKAEADEKAVQLEAAAIEAVVAKVAANKPAPVKVQKGK